MANTERSPDDKPFTIDDVIAEEPSVTEQLGLKYAADCADFRQSIYHKLRRHDALREGNGWSIFRLFDENTGSSVMSAGEETDIAVIVSPPIVSENERRYFPQAVIPPTIRIITNEKFVHGDLSSYLTTDFSLAASGLCRYFVDGCANDLPSLQTTRAPIFSYGSESNALMIVPNVTPQTPTQAIQSGENIVVPFGEDGCLEDSIFALNQGWQLLARILDCDPVHTGTFL